MSYTTVRLQSHRQYSIAWIAVLTVELVAAEAMLDEEHERPADFEQNRADANAYTWGRMGHHNIVIACLPAGFTGTNSAAVTVSQLASSLPHIRVGILVGIGGAIPQTKTVWDSRGRPIELIRSDRDIRLGDVVVSHPQGTNGGVVQYDMGKARTGRVWQRTGFLNPPPTALLSALAMLKAQRLRGISKMPQLLADMWRRWPVLTRKRDGEPPFTHQGFDNDRLFRADYGHRVADEDCRGCDPSQQVRRPQRATAAPEVHMGVIASGNTLVKDAAVRRRIAESTGEDCICYEMEAAGIMSHFPCLVVRGISDYADCHKNDQWQPFASAAAAACAKELISYVPAQVLDRTMPIRNMRY